MDLSKDSAGRCTIASIRGTLQAHMVRLPLRVLAFSATAILLTATLAGAATRDPSAKLPVYKWTDEKGVVHYGDAVPPQYADQDKTVLNSQGVQVGTIPGRRTPEQQAAEAARRTAEERAAQTALQKRQRDQNLLA